MTTSPAKPAKSYRRWLLHAYRVGIFIFLLFMIRQQHSWFLAQRHGGLVQEISTAEILSFYPDAASLSDWDPGHGGQNVLDAEGNKLGHVIQTSPDADDINGFSGPTNTLVALDPSRKILGIKVLQSDDTKEHLKKVKTDDTFLKQWNQLTTREAADKKEFHTVSGATLSSVAIADGISTRFGGGKRTPRFPKEISISEVTPFLEGAATLEAREKQPYLFAVKDTSGELIGYATRTAPHSDDMMGYQGPTDVLIVMDPDQLVIGLAIRDTYDNEPYVKLLDEDEYFFNTFKGFELQQISEIDIVESGIDVVSGATKTSVNVTEGLILSAREVTKIQEPTPPPPLISLRVRDVGTILVALFGIIIAMTRLKGNRKLRFAFQGVLILYLGFINADMLSQALLVGWSRSGVAWSVAPGLVFLTAAALLAPIFTGKQAYCTHLCPYGAAQDWLGKKTPWKIAVKGRLEKILSALPTLLLLWCLIIAMGHLPFSLVGLEPFDGFVFRVAGWATLTIAVIGLIASLFINRAYCRYGCPTGAMLKFIRFGGAASDRLGRRDFVAAGFALVAIVMMIWR